MKTKRMDEIQALRGWAFLGVFLHHAAFYFDWGYVGVSAFFVLSGFFATIRPGGDERIPSPFDSIKKALQKTLRLYPLHIVMLCMITPLVMEGVIYSWQLRPVAKQFLLNVFLLQSWSPDHYDNISFNGVTWFLSTMMFLYIVIPYFAYFVRRHDKRISLLIAIVTMLIQTAACVVYLKKYGIDNINFDWFSYVFPPAHLLDTFVGCVLGKIYLESKDEEQEQRSVKATLYELVLLIATGIFYYWMEQPEENIVMAALKNRTVLYILPACLWIWVFIKQKGYISKALSIKPFKWLGDMSGDLYLVHFVVIQYIWDQLTKHHIRFKTAGRPLLSVSGLAVSVLICIVVKILRDIMKRSRSKV
ncbi:MAG: acyltransferase [Lachnospiraceae bacterium]|nr:acyltransferase [Lachnospiraceae bacterium]